jgi:hypothetical protein
MYAITGVTGRVADALSEVVSAVRCRSARLPDPCTRVVSRTLSGDQAGLYINSLRT